MQVMQAELEARLDFDEELPPLDTAALSQRIGALGQQVQVSCACTCICASAPQICKLSVVLSPPHTLQSRLAANPQFRLTCQRLSYAMQCDRSACETGRAGDGTAGAAAAQRFACCPGGPTKCRKVESAQRLVWQPARHRDQCRRHNPRHRGSR